MLYDYRCDLCDQGFDSRLSLELCEDCEALVCRRCRVRQYPDEEEPVLCLPCKAKETERGT